MTHHRVMTSSSWGIGFLGKSLYVNVMYLFRREIKRLCRLRHWMKLLSRQCRNKVKKIEIYLVGGYSDHLRWSRGAFLGDKIITIVISDVDYPRRLQKIRHLWASFFLTLAKNHSKIGAPTLWRHNSVMSHQIRNSQILSFTFSISITIQKSDLGYLSPFSRRRKKTDSRF